MENCMSIYYIFIIINSSFTSPYFSCTTWYFTILIGILTLPVRQKALLLILVGPINSPTSKVKWEHCWNDSFTLNGLKKQKLITVEIQSLWWILMTLIYHHKFTLMRREIRERHCERQKHIQRLENDFIHAKSILKLREVINILKKTPPLFLRDTQRHICTSTEQSLGLSTK